MTRSRLAGFAAVGVLGLAGLAGLWMQAIQQPANHPQVEMAAAAVSRLDGGESPTAVLPARKIDLAQSTEPFLIVVDPQRSVLASSASLNGQVVLPPQGVFDYVSAHGEDRVTWQPTPHARSWIVVDKFRGGYVVAGRSPANGEADGYLVAFWLSLGALGLAVTGVVGLLLTR